MTDDITRPTDAAGKHLARNNPEHAEAAPGRANTNRAIANPSADVTPDEATMPATASTQGSRTAPEGSPNVHRTERTDIERDEEVDTKGRRRPPLLALIVGITAVISLMLLAFATPAVHSGAKDLPLAVSGPEQAVAQVKTQLEKKQPDAFDVKAYSSADDARDAIKNRDAIGGIAVGKDGVTIQTASGAGSPYANALRGLGAGLEKQGQKVTYTDVVPLPAADPAGAAMTSAGLPLIFGGMVTSALTFFGLRGSAGRRAATILGVSVLAGLAAAAILHVWLDATTGSYWPLAAAFSLGIAAIAFTVIGLAKNLGPAGFGLGALIMFFMSNPISGLATGADWLPKPWGAIGQFLPVGAAGTALRSAAYFDGRGATHAWIVLACWALVGALLLAIGRARKTTH